MALVLIVVAVVLLFAIIWWLTGGQRLKPVFNDEESIHRVLSLADVGLNNSRSDVEADILQEMLQRMGLDGHDALVAAGFDVPSDSAKNTWQVIQRPDDLQMVLTEAFMVGVQVARTDDDYAGVSDDRLSDEGRVDLAETTLFGDERRERYTVFGKAALVLQDMLHDETEVRRKETIVALLHTFDGQIEALQKEMEDAMAQVPEQDVLLWGDGADRRLYYFKMGVTDVLRRSGKLESLRHLYQLRGVNYNVEEAFRLAANECPSLALAESVGIAFLIGMGPADVQSWIQRALKG